MADTDQDWQLGVGWDYRFGTLGFQMHKPGEEAVVRFVVPLKLLLERAGVKPWELRAILDEKYEWTEGLEDIDSARVRLLEETDWKDKAVLDVGGYDGFAAEIAHKGGAATAICLDNHQYETYGWADIKKAGVEYIQGDFMDYHLGQLPVDYPDRLVPYGRGPDLPQPDVIIFYNVLYHLKDNWGALERLRTFIKPGGEMLLCTLHRYHDGPWVYLYEPRECNESDSSVFWGPSLDALERLLKFTGWEATKYALSYDRVLYRCLPTLEPQSRNSKY